VGWRQVVQGNRAFRRHFAQNLTTSNAEAGGIGSETLTVTFAGEELIPVKRGPPS
jgi:hypothetical protein